MVAVYQLIFFLALGLLAMSITVFVLAVSLLGRAISMAIEAQDKVNKEHSKADTEKMEEIQGELKQAKTENRLPDIKRLGKAVSSLKWKRWIKNWKLKWIQAKPKLLGSVWGAFIPGAFFLASAIISILAILKASGTPAISPYMWIVIATMTIGICFVCLSLKVIGEVARSSDEVAFRRDVDVFETSLRKFEEEKRPKLKFHFIGKLPPFHVKADSEITIRYGVSLIEGWEAEDVHIAFFLPKGFGFPGKETISQPLNHSVLPEYITVNTQFEEGILSGARVVDDIRIKVTSKADKYEAYCRVFCKGFIGVYEKFEIMVK